MGYSTDYLGTFKLSKPLTPEQRAYIAAFSDKRRMKRNGKIASTLDDPLRKAVKLRIGVEGGYFTGGLGFAGQDEDDSVVDHNEPPKGQPGLWCHWVPDETGEYIGWDGGEKFYNDVEWLQYLIDHFFAPWDITLKGVVQYQGERDNDHGILLCNGGYTVAKLPGSKRKATHSEIMQRETCMFGSKLLLKKKKK